MSRTLSRLTGSGTGGAFVAGTTSPPADRLTDTVFVSPLKDNVDLLLAALLQRNVYAGGSMSIDLAAEVAGSYDLDTYIPIGVDNTGLQITGFSDTHSAVLVVQFRFFVQVSNSAVSVTPRVYNITTSAAATTSGAAACTATNEDYSGSNQQQTLALTLPTGVNYFKPQFTVGGTPAPGYRARVLAMYDCYISLP